MRRIYIIVIIAILFIYVSLISAVDAQSSQNKNAAAYTIIVDQIYGFYSSNSSENISNETMPIAPAATISRLSIELSSKSDTAILIIVLISTVILSGRIKGNNEK